MLILFLYNIFTRGKTMDITKYAIIDLHLHLDGALSAKQIIECAVEENVLLPTYDEDELKKYLQVDETCSSLIDYLKKFDIPNRVLQTKNGLRKCTLDLLRRLSEQGLKYVEIRMAPMLSTNRGLCQEDVILTILDALLEGRELYGLKANLILCLMRGNRYKQNLLTCDLAKKYLGKGVVAVDIAGDEKTYPNDKIDGLLEYINALALPFTIHSGESLGHESIDYALRYHPLRIGHGVNAIQSIDTMTSLRMEGIYLEVCPTSNVDTKAFPTINDVPVKPLLNAGVLVTINTDDPTVSNVTLKDEYLNLVKMGLSEEDIYQIVLNSINGAFLSKEEKEQLIDYVNSLN